MAVKIASLFIALGADGSELTKETKKGVKTVKRYGDAVGKIGSRAGAAFSALTVGVVAANAALAVGYKRNSDYIISLGDVAAKLGDTATNVKALQFAGEQQQIAQTSINTGLQRMVRRLSEAAQGTGEARGAIKELGLDAKLLKKQLPTEALDTILHRMSLIPNQADRVRIAFKLFDTEGVDFVRLVGNTRQAKEELIAMGGALSAIDVARVAEAGVSITKVQTAARAIAERFTVIGSGPVKVIADQLYEAAKQGGQLESVMRGAVGFTILGASKILDISATIIRFTSQNPDTVQFGALGFLLLGRKGAALGAVLGQITGIYERVAASVRSEQASFGGGEVEQLAARLANLQGVLVELESRGGIAGDAVAARIEKVKGAIASIQTQLTDIGASGVTALQQTEAGASRVQQVGVAVADSLTTASGALKVLIDDMGRLKDTPIEAPTIPLPAAAANDPGAANLAADSRTQQLRENLRAFYAEEDAAFQAADQKRRLSLGQTVKIIGDTQGTWTKFQKEGAAGRAQILSGELASAFSSASGHSKKLFKLNQIASYANAVVSGGQAAASALATQPFFPTGLAMLGVAIAKTGSLLLSIKKQKFQKSGTVSASGGSASSGGSSVPAAATAASSSSIPASGGGGEIPGSDGSAANSDFQQYVQLTVIAAPGMSRADADRQGAEELARNVRANRVRSDAIVTTSIEYDRSA